MKRTRREFLKTGSMMAAGSLISPSIVSAENIIQTQTGGTLTKHELPKLPYAYDALEPYIDAKTMELHHSKHHQAYVTGLIKAEEELSKARASNDFILVQHWSRRAAFNGGGHFLHAMFWKVMAPNGKGGGGEPDGMLLDKIKEDFGDYKMFMENFSAAARDVEGGGWALLHYRRSDKRLIVLQVENQHKLSAWDTVPVLGIDVWEHAYYLKYQNQRAEYVKNWWNVVNWKQVADNLKAAM